MLVGQFMTSVDKVVDDKAECGFWYYIVAAFLWLCWSWLRLGVWFLGLARKWNSYGEGSSLSTFRNVGSNQKDSVQMQSVFPAIWLGALALANSQESL